MRKNKNMSGVNQTNRYVNHDLSVQKNTIPRSVTTVVADQMRVRLSYRGFTTLTITTLIQAISKRWTPSAAYDVDPVLGSTTVIGFSEWASLYGAYRVRSSKIVTKFSNTSTQPVVCIQLPSNVDPGATPSAATAGAFLNQPFSTNDLLGPTGCQKVVLENEMSTEKIYGSKMVHMDDNFAALTNAIPVNNWYWIVSCQVSTPPSSNINITVMTDIWMDVDFYDRKSLVN